MRTREISIRAFLLTLIVVCPLTMFTACGSSAPLNLNPENLSPSDVGGGEGAPTISSLFLSSGPVAGGNTITINGTNFDSSSGALFGSNLASSVHEISSTELTVVVPAASGPGNVTITVNNATGSTATATYQYVAPPAGEGAPTISSLSQSSGAQNGGYSIQINGTNFDSSSKVLFGHVSASISASSSSQLTVTVPAASASGTVTIVVSNATGSTASTPFTYVYTYSAVAYQDPNDVYGVRDDGHLIQYASSDGVNFTPGDLSLLTNPSAPSRLLPAIAAYVENGAEKVYGIRTDGTLDLFQWTSANGWQEFNLSKSTNPANPTTFKAHISAYGEGGVDNVFVITSSGMMEQFQWTSTYHWREMNLSVVLGGSAPTQFTGGLSTYLSPDGAQELFAIDVSGAMQEMRWTFSGGWAQLNLSQATLSGSLTTFKGDVSGYTDSSGIRDVFAVGTNGSLIQFQWTSANGWKQYNLSGSSAQFVGPISAFEQSGIQNVFLTRNDGALIQYQWTNTNGWQSGSLSQAVNSSHPPTLVGNLAATAIGASQNIFAIQSNGALVQFQWTYSLDWLFFTL